MNLYELESILTRMEKDITGNPKVSISRAASVRGIKFEVVWAEGIWARHIVDAFDTPLDEDYLVTYLVGLFNKQYLAEKNKKEKSHES